MKQWVTEIKAIEPDSGEMRTWGGPHIVAPSWELAQEWCREHCGYLKVVGELVAEIPCKKGTYEPDWKNRVDYDVPSMN